jgi:hypothetical protein
MLTKEHAIARFENGTVVPDRLTRRTHAAYLIYAQRMLDAYRQSIGRTRRELHNAVAALFACEADCPVRRIAAFCRLLDDAGTWSHDRAGKAAALRRQVFHEAAQLHPLVQCADKHFSKEEHSAKHGVASQLGTTWNDIDARLFADVLECQRLQAFNGFESPEALLARYNVGQVQVALFRAIDMTVSATEDFKTILRYAKLARLMHSIRRCSGDRVMSTNQDAYEIRFDGPASVLRLTRRYGSALAKFLPALVACRGWRLHARLQTPRRGHFVGLDLSCSDGLHSHLPPPEEFDSKVEERFARDWAEKRDGWVLERESEILHDAQTVFMPDFVLRHDDGRKVLLEIVGFWTPEYLRSKAQRLRQFARYKILIAADQPATARADDFPGEVIPFRKRLNPTLVLERLQSAAG